MYRLTVLKCACRGWLAGWLLLLLLLLLLLQLRQRRRLLTAFRGVGCVVLVEPRRAFLSLARATSARTDALFLCSFLCGEKTHALCAGYEASSVRYSGHLALTEACVPHPRETIAHRHRNHGRRWRQWPDKVSVPLVPGLGFDVFVVVVVACFFSSFSTRGACVVAFSDLRIITAFL